MSDGYTKLFSSILDSSVWFEDHATRLVWIAMLAMANRDGVVGAAVPGLAARARVTIAEAEGALAKFLAPDPYSRSPEHEGRRIEKCDGGWRLLNHMKHREKMSREDRLERDAQRKRDARAVRGHERTEADVARTNADASEIVRDVSHAEAEAEAEADPKAEAEKMEIPRKRGTPKLTTLPDGFCLTAKMAEYARERHGWEPSKIVSVFEDFVGSAVAKSYRYANWEAAWQGWVRKEPDFARSSATMPASRASTTNPVFQRQLEHVRQLEAEEKAKAS